MLEETPSNAIEHKGDNKPLAGGSVCDVPLGRRLAAHFPRGQFFRYLIVGCWNTVFAYGTYAAFTALLMPRLRFGYVVAQVLAGSLNITVAYLGYKFFVFKTKGNYLREWLRCMAVYGVGAIPSLVLLPLIVQALHYGLHLGHSAPYIGGALLTGLSVLYSFIGHKNFSFRVPENASDDLIERVQEEAKARR